MKKHYKIEFLYASVLVNLNIKNPTRKVKLVLFWMSVFYLLSFQGSSHTETLQWNHQRNKEGDKPKNPGFLRTYTQEGQSSFFKISSLVEKRQTHNILRRYWYMCGQGLIQRVRALTVLYLPGPLLSQPHTIVPMLSPMPLYWYTMLASSLDAAATEMRSLLRSS